MDAVVQHIDELIPEGDVVVDRARFERLREYVAAYRALEHGWSNANAHEGHRGFDLADDKRRLANERFARAKFAIQSTDIDPLP
jgi:hypothetical protein